jgi:anti-sigma-K factor RskA
MTHAEMDELYELYALGALETGDASEIDRHVTDACDYCLSHIRRAVTATAMLSGMADPLEPSADVRRRLLAGITPAAATTTPIRSVSKRWNLWIPALGAACAALLVLSVWLSINVVRTRGELSHVARERNQMREALQVLSSSQPTMIQFGHSSTAPRGTVFFNRNGGFVMTGSRLPEIASDKTFELWVIPKSGAPIPAGLFQPQNAGGSFVHVYQEPLDTNKVAAVAVTVEPSGGSLAPTSKPFLVVPLG